MRTIRSLLALPVSVITFCIGNLLFNIIGLMYNGFSSYDDGIHSFGMVDIIMTWVLIYVANSIVPVVMANFVMLMMLEGEDRFWMSIIPKVIFATFGMLIFSVSLHFRISTGIELEKYLVCYLLSIASFVTVPIVLNKHYN